jgi:hypothetical protein
MMGGAPERSDELRYAMWSSRRCVVTGSHVPDVFPFSTTHGTGRFADNPIIWPFDL